MEHKFLLLVILLPIATSQTVEEILNSIGDLTQIKTNYQLPENYNEFKHSPLYYAGKYDTYDFIIIGGGTAGTVLANRLSEVTKWKILLLEAGQNETLYTDIPAMAAFLQRSDFNWGYKTVPQKGCCLGMNNNECFVPRGKGLGGSSTINFMMYSRGNSEDFDKWSKDGNPGWSYDEVLPYFLKSENSSMTENIDKAYHSNKGSLHVEHIRHFESLSQSFLDGAEELGRKVMDYNGKSEMGYSRLQSTTINGRRCSGNKAFLTPVVHRDNLKVLKGAFVTKMIIDKKNGGTKVLGVQFLLGNMKYIARVRMEVILSAGTIASPQILMHSGIGPSKHLQSLGIKVVADLAVGKNLHDHPVLVYPLKTSYVDPGIKPINELAADYLNGFGILTAAGDVESIGFINTENTHSSNPDIEQLLLPFFDGDDIFREVMNFKNETYKALFRFQEDTQYTTDSIIVLLHQKSRGEIKLKSSNIYHHPLIDLNYFSDPDDIEVLIKGLKDFITITKTEAMAKYNISVAYSPMPGCPQDFLSDDYLRCLVRHVATTLYHQGGTCKMGPVTDKESVVDHKLKVRGVQNLRVIDASVIPSPLSGHPNAAVYMIAEKGSDIIKKDWSILN